MMLAALGLLAFLALLLLVRRGATLGFDRAVTRAVQRPDSPALLALMEAVSWPGDQPQCIAIGLLIAAAFAVARRWAASGMLLLALLSLPLTLLLKRLADRPRPSVALDGVIVHGLASGSGFPSAHVLSYTVVGGFLAYLAWNHLRPGPLRRLSLALAFALLVLVGPSRIYLGEHWFVDVVASYAIGLSCLVGVVALYRALRGRPLPPRRIRV